MLEVVGVDMGNLGRASLRVSGNVNINGKMVFQEQLLTLSPRVLETLSRDIFT